MRQGVDKEQLFEQFGGRGAFDDGATQIVHYVYQYRDSQDMSRDRIAERAAGRCRSGAFDGVNCQSLPSAYTDSTGGCRAAVTVQRADYNVDAFAIDREQLAERQRAQAELTRKQAEDMRKHHAQQKRAAECRKKHEQEIARIEVLIQAGSDPRSHRSKLRKLREKLAKCGPYTQVSPPEVQPQPGGYHRLRNR